MARILVRGTLVARAVAKKYVVPAGKQLAAGFYGFHMSIYFLLFGQQGPDDIVPVYVEVPGGMDTISKVAYLLLPVVRLTYRLGLHAFYPRKRGFQYPDAMRCVYDR
jgi:hypothetical protein